MCNIQICILVSLLSLMTWTSSITATLADREKFEFFDDYLHHAIQRQINRTHMPRGTLVGVPDDVIMEDQTPSGRMMSDEPYRNQNSIPETPNLDVLTFFRDVPKRHWSCCLLGKLAGDKGFLCQAQFYSERLLSNNENRPQNRWLPFSGPEQEVSYGEALMGHFSRCVSRKEEQFHTCCYAATMERLALDRWRRYVNHQASMERRRHH